MKRRNLRLLIMLGVLVLAVALYVALVLVGRGEDEAEEAELIRLFEVDNTTVIGLGWDYNGQQIELAKSGEGIWKWTGDEACPISTSAVEGLINSLTAVTAARVVNTPASLEEYGLDTPTYNFTATLVSGHKISLTLGDYSSYAMGYYASVSGKEGVFVVAEDIVTAYSVGVMDILQYETAPDLTAATELVVTAGGESITLRYYADSSGMSYSDSYHWFVQQNGGRTAASTQKVEELLGSLSNLYWTDCIAYNADAQMLADHGIGGEDSVSVTAVYETAGGKTSFTLLLGDYVGGGCYANIKGSGMLYTVTGATADRFILLDEASICATEVCMVDGDRIMSLAIDTGEQSALIDYAGEESDIDVEGEPFSVPVWQRGGEKLPAEDVLSMLDALTSLRIEERVGNEYGRRQLLSIVLTLDSGEEIHLSLYSYSSTQCIAKRDDHTYLVSSAQAQSLIDAAAALLPAAE